MGRASAWARIAALALLALGVTGMHEVIDLMLCIVLVTGTAVTLSVSQSTRRRQAWIAVSVIALVGLAVDALAPGNGVRAQTLPGREFTLIQVLELTAAAGEGVCASVGARRPAVGRDSGFPFDSCAGPRAAFSLRGGDGYRPG